MSMLDGPRRNLADDGLTQAVVESFAGSSDHRFREVMTSLVRHLHAFASEVALTEREWELAMDFLARTGHTCTDERHEFILLSDVLGLSMLVVGLNHRGPGRATESTVFGPFFVEGSRRYELGDDIANGAPGELCLIRGRVVNVDGSPVADARVEVWQADDHGLYDVQYEDLDEPRGRGHFLTDDNGRFWFWSIKPEPYPIPEDGPVGELLKAAQRSPMRPAHVHFMVSAEGYRTVITHVFVDGDRHLDSDAVFGVKSSLIADFHRHEPGRTADGRVLDRPYWSMTYDFALAPSAERK
jgi:hydroxyquinol 1,2-dioxygenase